MMEKPVLGIGLAIVTFAIIILTLQFEHSLLDLAFGFFIFILPLTFLRSLKSNFLAYFFTIFSIIIIYFSYSMERQGVIYGLILAALIGFTISDTRIKNYKLFSVSNYEKEVEEIRKND